RPSSFVMCKTPVEVQFTSAGCLNYPCRTPQRAQDRLVQYSTGNGTRVRRGATRSLNCLSAPASVACCHDDDERFEGDFQMTGKAFGIAVIAAFMLLAANGLAKAATAGEINASVNATLDRFYRQIPGARELSARATGGLVFPTVLKAGFGVGGEYGE